MKYIGRETTFSDYVAGYEKSAPAAVRADRVLNGTVPVESFKVPLHFLDDRTTGMDRIVHPITRLREMRWIDCSETGIDGSISGSVSQEEVVLVLPSGKLQCCDARVVGAGVVEVEV